TLVTAGGAGGDVTLTTVAGNIAVNTVSAVGDRVTLNAAAAITDLNGAAHNITATDLVLKATTGIGTGVGTSFTDELETTVSNLDASNTTSGGIYLRNIGGLTIKDLDSPADGLGLVSVAGGRIAAMSPLTISSNATIGASMALIAGDNIGTLGDDLTINNNAVVTFSATGGTLTLQAGDNIAFGTGAASGQVSVTGSGDSVVLFADHEGDAPTPPPS